MFFKETQAWVPLLLQGKSADCNVVSAKVKLPATKKKNTVAYQDSRPQDSGNLGNVPKYIFPTGTHKLSFSNNQPDHRDRYREEEAHRLNMASNSPAPRKVGALGRARSQRRHRVRISASRFISSLSTPPPPLVSFLFSLRFRPQATGPSEHRIRCSRISAQSSSHLPWGITDPRI